MLNALTLFFPLVLAALATPAGAWTVSCGSAPVDSGPQNEMWEGSTGFCDTFATATPLPDGIDHVFGSVTSFGLGDPPDVPNIPQDDDWFALPDAQAGVPFTVSVILLNSAGLLLLVWDENLGVLTGGTFSNEGAFVDIVGVTPATGGPLFFQLVARGDGDLIGYEMLIDVARVPEPGTALLVCVGLVSLAIRGRS